MLLYTGRGLLNTFPALAIGSSGIIVMFITLLSVLLLSITGLYYWHKRVKFGTQLLLGAWVIMVAFSITVSWGAAFISIETLIGIPVVVLLAYTIWKDRISGKNT